MRKAPRDVAMETESFFITFFFIHLPQCALDIKTRHAERLYCVTGEKVPTTERKKNCNFMTLIS